MFALPCLHQAPRSFTSPQRTSKGSITADNSIQVKAQMHPLKKSANTLLRPTAMFLVPLLQQGAFRAHGPDGPKVKIQEQMLATPAHCLVGVGKELIFQTLSGSFLEVNETCALLWTYTQSFGLPYASFHKMQQDFGQQIKLLFGRHNHMQADAPSGVGQRSKPPQHRQCQAL